MRTPTTSVEFLHENVQIPQNTSRLGRHDSHHPEIHKSGFIKYAWRLLLKNSLNETYLDARILEKEGI